MFQGESRRAEGGGGKGDDFPGSDILCLSPTYHRHTIRFRASFATAEDFSEHHSTRAASCSPGDSRRVEGKGKYGPGNFSCALRLGE